MFCQIPTTNETVQCSFNVCFPPEGLLPFFCSSSFVQFFWRSAAYMLSVTSLVWVNACMCFCLEWVICLCLKWLRHDQKSVIPLVYVQHVWISFTMYFITFLHEFIGVFLCENVPQWCVANLRGLSVLDAYQKGSSHKTAHMSLTAQLTSSECHETLLILFTQTICYQSTMSLVKQGFCMCAT